MPSQIVFYALGGVFMIAGLVLMLVFQNQSRRPVEKEERVRRASYLFMVGLAFMAFGWFVA